MRLKYVDSGSKDTRSGFGDAMTELAKKNPQVVALCADLVGSLKLEGFIEHAQNRFFQCGIAEANMIGVAAGLSIGGKIPFAATFANFATGRVYDQIRQSVCYSNLNVKICASHAGLTLGEDGATHQILEDVGMMKMLPNMTVIVPCDYNQTKLATLALANHVGPAYLRFGRPKVPNFTTSAASSFTIGKVQILTAGLDVTIFANGHLVWEALQAAEQLHGDGIECEVINVHTVKPLDVEGVLTSVRKTRAVVTAEEHMINGGMGESISKVLSTQQPTIMGMVGVNDTFGESGKPEELMQKYDINAQAIIQAVKKVLARKNGIIG